MLKFILRSYKGCDSVKCQRERMLNFFGTYLTLNLQFPFPLKVPINSKLGPLSSSFFLRVYVVLYSSQLKIFFKIAQYIQYFKGKLISYHNNNLLFLSRNKPPKSRKFCLETWQNNVEHIDDLLASLTI